jgi:hypothetical protein
MQSDKFKTNMAILVAVVTVLGALAACLATSAMSDAGDEDFAGLESAIAAQKAEIINQLNAYEHYRAYTTYTRYVELGNLMYDANADEKASLANGAGQREAWGVASGLLSSFFQGRYIDPDGQYDIQRELDEAWAEDAQGTDLDPASHFESSDRARRQASFLTADMIAFAISFWFLTLAQVVEKQVKYLWAVLGIMFGLAGILGILIGRFMI